jgi:hypothetical protein
MTVTDEQVAALRALLAGDVNENRRLLAQLDRRTEGAGYSALVNAAFFEAIDRRFGKDSAPASIVEYVADVRSRSDNLAAMINPNAGERVIQAVLTGEPAVDIDSRASATVKLFLLTALIADEDLVGEDFDQFLVKVRKMADYLLRED